MFLKVTNPRGRDKVIENETSQPKDSQCAPSLIYYWFQVLSFNKNSVWIIDIQGIVLDTTLASLKSEAFIA